MKKGIENPGPISTQAEPLWLATLQRQVGGLRFGVVQVIVHEAQVVQIETTERVRFEPAVRGGSAIFQQNR